MTHGSLQASQRLHKHLLLARSRHTHLDPITQVRLAELIVEVLEHTLLGIVIVLIQGLPRARLLLHCRASVLSNMDWHSEGQDTVLRVQVETTHILQLILGSKTDLVRQQWRLWYILCILVLLYIVVTA